MKDKIENPQAFPSIRNVYDGGTGTRAEMHGGMDLRDYFAGLALQGIIGGRMMPDIAKAAKGDSRIVDRVIATLAYDLADFMLAERNRRRGGEGE